MTETDTNQLHRIPRKIVARIIAQEFGINESAMLGSSRAHELCHARFAASHIMAKVCGYSRPKIGACLNRDHTTVTSAVQRADQLLKSDAGFADMYAAALGKVVSWRYLDPGLVSERLAAPSPPQTLENAPAVKFEASSPIANPSPGMTS